MPAATSISRSTSYRPGPNLPASAGVVRLDLAGDQDEAVAVLARYDLVVLAIGPFEEWRVRAHRLCIAAGVDCLDINDSVEPAKEILALDAEAKQAGVRVFTGMGLSPGLTTLLLLDVMRQASSQQVQLRSRLFVGGRQRAGYSAIRAMLASFGPYVPEIHGGVCREIPADDTNAESRYWFPGMKGPLLAFHYPTPETCTLQTSALCAYIGEMDYRVHFQGMPPAFVFLLRRLPPLRTGPLAGGLARIVHLIHAVGHRFRDAGVIAIAECSSATGTDRAVATAPSSYAATAAFASAMAELVLQDRLSLPAGAFSFESCCSERESLLASLRQRDVIVRDPIHITSAAAGEVPCRSEAAGIPESGFQDNNVDSADRPRARAAAAGSRCSATYRLPTPSWRWESRNPNLPQIAHLRPELWCERRFWTTKPAPF